MLRAFLLLTFKFPHVLFARKFKIIYSNISRITIFYNYILEKKNEQFLEIISLNLINLMQI